MRKWNMNRSTATRAAKENVMGMDAREASVMGKDAREAG